MKADASPPEARRKPRILLFVPVLVVGGAERHTVDLCDWLRQRGFDCRIVVHGAARSEAITDTPGGRDAIFLNLKGMSELRGWWTIRRLFREMNPDIIVGINQTPLIISVIERAIGATRARLCCIFHTTQMQAFEAYQARIFAVASRFADALVYVSETQREFWTRRGVATPLTRVIINGVDIDRFAPRPEAGMAIRLAYGLAQDDFVVSVAASFRPEKNHREFVEAMALLRGRGVAVKALLMGGGETLDATKGLVDTLGLGDRILFAGEQREVNPFMCASDAGVLCGKAETLPLSALEYLASGTPMICTRVGGVGEILQHGVNGLLYESGSSVALADAIAAMADPAFRKPLAERARSSISHLSLTDMHLAYERLFLEMVAQ